MARKVFFSFHFGRDIWRVNQIRNAWVVQGVQETGFWDASIWQEKKRLGSSALKTLIRDGLEGTTVTAVLIGDETFSREWVQYEIAQSWIRGNGLIGIYLDGVRDQRGSASGRGFNPFLFTSMSEPRVPSDLGLKTRTYGWVANDGYANIGNWISAAAPLIRMPRWP